MAERPQYAPGPARPAQVRPDGDKWTLILERQLHHAPEKVWLALTEPAHLREWAPYDADSNLGATGGVNLTWTGTGRTQPAEVTRADAPHLLEVGDIRWELEAKNGGTRLKLWHSIGGRFVAWGAAGWHIAFDVLERLLAGEPIGRIAGADAMKHGWQRLVAEYSAQFGMEAAGAPAKPAAES